MDESSLSDFYAFMSKEKFYERYKQQLMLNFKISQTASPFILKKHNHL